MTIKEIARLAKVSPATVSRVFSHQPGIKDEVRTRVFDIARQHGYHPRFSTRQKNVVIIVPEAVSFAVHSCVDMLLIALTAELPRHGFRIEILPVGSLERLNSMQFCGAVAIGCEAEDFAGWHNQFAVPLVIVDRSPTASRRGNVCYVHSDEVQGMTIALEHLIQSGCRKIGCIVHGVPERGNALLRFNTIEQVLKKHLCPVGPRMLCYSGDGSEKYVEIIGKMLKYGVDALFCPGGNAGLIAIYALSLYSKNIPEDVSLIASEQTAFSTFTVPPQTTISPDYGGLASKVAEVLTGWLEGRGLPGSVMLPYSLIIRESTM